MNDKGRLTWLTSLLTTRGLWRGVAITILACTVALVAIRAAERAENPLPILTAVITVFGALLGVHVGQRGSQNGGE